MLKPSLLLALLSLPACAGAPENLASDEHDQTITPGTGTATVTFGLPPGSVAATIMLQRSGDPSVSELKPGVVAALPEGEYCVWTKLNGYETKPGCSYTLTGAMTVELGAVRFGHGRNEAVLGVDLPIGGADASMAAFLTQTGVVLPHAAGHFDYTYSSNYPSARYLIDVEAAKVADVDLTETTGHEALRLIPPPARETSGTWGGAVSATVQVIINNVNIARFSSIGDRPVLVRSRTHVQVQLELGSFIAAHPFTDPTTIPDLVLQRLDVKLPVVTLADGSKSAVGAGNCLVSPKNGIGTLQFALPGGLDLPLGDYIANVSYVHPATNTLVNETYPLSFH